MKIQAGDWVSYCGSPWLVVWIKCGMARISDGIGVERTVDLESIHHAPTCNDDPYLEE